MKPVVASLRGFLRRATSVLTAAGSFLISVPFAFGMSEPPPTHTRLEYFYFDEAMPLTVDPSHVILHMESPALSGNAIPAEQERVLHDIRSRAEQVAVAVGLDPKGVTESAGEVWVDVREAVARQRGQTAEASIRSLVAELAAQPGVAFASPQLIGPNGGEMRIANGLILGLKGVAADPLTTDTVSVQLEADAAIMATVRGVRDVRRLGVRDGYRLVRTTERDGFKVLEQANALARSGQWRFAEPLMIVEAELAQQPVAHPQAWGLKNTGHSGGLVGFDIKAEDAWATTTGSPTVTVAIIDTGIDPTHPGLAGRVLPGSTFNSHPTYVETYRDSFDGTPYYYTEGHGTAVAGMVVGAINGFNGQNGLSGSAPNVRVVSAKLGFWTFGAGTPPNDNPVWSFYPTDLIDALRWISENGYRISNSSFGSPSPLSSISASFSDTRVVVDNISTVQGQYSITSNVGRVVHFAASGNYGSGQSNAVRYPAAYPDVVAVGSANRFGNRSSFSCFGPELDIMGPGETVPTTLLQPAAVQLPTRKVISWTQTAGLVDGTSFASPTAAGVAALLLSQNPDWTPFTIEARLTGTARDMGTVGRDDVTGWGLVNAQAALAPNWQLYNISTRGFTGTGGDTLTMGFVLDAPGRKRVLLRGVGPSLASFGVAGTLPDPQITLHQIVSGVPTILASNDDWSSQPNAADVSAAAARVGAFALNSGTKDAALLHEFTQPGIFTLQVAGANSTSGVVLAELYDADADVAGLRVVNLSSRGFVGTGSAVFTPGLVIQGTNSRTVMIRGVGPELAGFGIPGTLANPLMTVYRIREGQPNVVVATNDDWWQNNAHGTPSQIEAAAAQVGAFPLTNPSATPVVLLTLPPGLYTAVISGVGGTTGVVLAEVYLLP